MAFLGAFLVSFLAFFFIHDSFVTDASTGWRSRPRAVERRYKFCWGRSQEESLDWRVKAEKTEGKDND